MNKPYSMINLSMKFLESYNIRSEHFNTNWYSILFVFLHLIMHLIPSLGCFWMISSILD